MPNYKFRKAAKVRKFTAFLISALLVSTLISVLFYQDGINIFELIANCFSEEIPSEKPSVSYP